MTHHIIGLLMKDTGDMKDWVVVSGAYSHGEATGQAISYFTTGGYDMNHYEVTKVDETETRPTDPYIPYEETGNKPNQ